MKIKAKKSLGQNFLKNKRLVKKIVEKANLKENDLVLEIGPGKGILTSELLNSGCRVLALEKDERMIEILTKKFSSALKNNKLFLFNGDALQIDYQKLKLENQKFSIVTNLPYYITGKFLSNILSHSIQPKKMILILQKEVVERIVSLNNKNSKLSLSVQVYGTPEYILPISKKNFSPAPKVDSALLKISHISKTFFQKNNITEKRFFELLKISFANKRKTLLNNLSQKYKKEKLEKIFSSHNFNLKVRAEDLKLQELLIIYTLL